MQVKTLGKGEQVLASEYLAAFQELAFERGIEPQRVLRDTDLPPDVFIQEHVKIGGDSMVQVARNCQALLADPMLPYDYAKRLTLSRHGTLGFALNSCANLREAILLLVDFISIRVQSIALVPELDCDPALVRVELSTEPDLDTLEITEEDLRIKELFDLTILACLALQTQQFLGPQTKPEIKVLTSYPSHGISTKILGDSIDIQFDSDFHGLSVPAAMLSCEPTLRNEDLSKAALLKCEEERQALLSNISLSAKVRNLMVDEELAEWRSIEDVSALLFMSPASLKRKLANEDTSFQRIKNAVRFSRAIQLLDEGSHSLDAIADELGYNNASNFSKAFKTWTGHSPKDYISRQHNA